MKTQPEQDSPNDESLNLKGAALEALLRDIFQQEEEELQHTQEQESAFDPIYIRDLIRNAVAQGQHPAKLVFGHEQADAYRDFLYAEYGESAPKGLKDSYFLGLQIVEEDIDNKLALVGEKPHDAWDAQFPPPWKDDNLHTPATDQAA